ncbi:hypothetical protein TTHERM_00127250 (macronuclear) [Tetrahymena thermophila SB210]|uniref:Uncharacterized protein n=1 Tax=Tetrahymena thermophila (strain SB210) TaxID=312017 RepID=I7LUU4_TETTS|nr:hypothetical protein TTHERM_00127250 [Tetrahymena thermophila SB210]EAR96060.1 hypothetical protein TTHERM_00127250 [Tetrahymena thermophila SB210]|eukprot:XP_001016305.1 hypothetical protein TTHERM_00127250 [Tetrahymena thermophila SB210]
MSCAGYRNFQSFGKSQYFKVGTRLWMIKVLGKNTFYKIFTNFLKPFSTLSKSQYTYQIQENEDEKDKMLGFEFVSIPTKQFFTKQIREIQLTQMINKKLNKSTNPFIYQEGLDGLSETKKEDSGVFNCINDKKSFVHSLQLINNPMAMDQFCLDEVETVVSEYDLEECNSLLQESMVISSMDSLYDSTTDTEVY